ncbi:MAG: MerC domain-containing protein [Candidatus Poribacteria bacterium]|nr:MerC domain-containing protein [Candidatus Poribacteria bacterium]
MKRHFNQEWVDTTGACLSVACAIHCLAMPLLVAVLPLIGLSFLANERAELVLISGAIALAIGSLAGGVRHHRRWRALLILIVALVFIATARTAVEGIFEVVFYSTGGILLASAHLVNRHLCKTCPTCEPEGV